ncbi:MAG: amidophosphoribosyltransferase [Eubacteriales bacterium]|nr:amidophosphoribosyltransferase [Eubacteriales bacterium]
MGGVFGVASKNDCVREVFFGTDYHSHLGTSRGGMAIWNGKSIIKVIHNIENAPFRTKFDEDLASLSGNLGMGCISDMEPQPLTVRSHLGHYAITTVGRINNIEELVQKSFSKGSTHFLEMSGNQINPTELVAALIDQEKSFVEGIKKVQKVIKGSCSILILTPDGFFAARDSVGRTPMIIGEKEGAYCISSESCALPNLGYSYRCEAGPGEILFVSADGIEQLSPPNDKMKVCAFLWVYYGYPSSTYEGVNVEIMRYRSGAALARRDNIQVDMVAGIPDSGVAHALGYANESKLPFARPFIKYTPTWPRSFMPQNQDVRKLIAHMKLIPIHQLIKDKKILFCEDSIVRGTQLRETAELLYEAGATEVHVRSACPPLVYGCKFLNFSRNRSDMDMAARQEIEQIEGHDIENYEEYVESGSDKQCCLIERLRKRLNLTSLKFQTTDDMLEAIGLPKEKVCTYCWNGRE